MFLLKPIETQAYQFFCLMSIYFYFYINPSFFSKPANQTLQHLCKFLSFCPGVHGFAEELPQEQPELLLPCSGKSLSRENAGTAAPGSQTPARDRILYLRALSRFFAHCSSSDGGRRVESHWRFPNTNPFSLYPSSISQSFCHQTYSTLRHREQAQR